MLVRDRRLIWDRMLIRDRAARPAGGTVIGLYCRQGSAPDLVDPVGLAALTRPARRPERRRPITDLAQRVPDSGIIL